MHVLTTIFWWVLYTLTVLFTIDANIIVVRTIANNRVTRTSTYFIIAGAAISDTLHVLIHAIPKLYGMALGRFPLSYEYIMPFTIVMIPCAQLTNALVQYRIFVQPNEQQRKTVLIFRTLFVIWLIGVCASLLTGTTGEYLSDIWLKFSSSHFNHIYDLVLLLFSLIVSGVGLFIIYRKLITEQPRSHVAVVKDDKMQMLCMNIITAGILIIGWLGIASSLVLIVLPFWNLHWFLFGYWMTYCSAMLKPILYVWKYQELRRHKQIIFPWVQAGNTTGEQTKMKND